MDTVAWAPVLYVALRLFSFLINMPFLEAIAVVIGVVTAELIPPDFLSGLCLG